ncbi:DNA transposition protein [Roseomonas sp. HJA6]|uniref:DNA transposition protein n=1 Tax=Roseomonas alba TaxID=2846776 RepID=A0ABS7ACD7_9PROT|nr:DNA transposition protein [Neoroseomonas alba]MBW6399961.1 DNA transposition protein [Neoroseomonas alba]
MAPQHPAQLDLLDWQPPEASVRFPEEQVRAATFAARLSRAVSVALGECGIPREEIAARMSAYLGETVSPAMLDAYASQARADHKISVPRFLALLHATKDRRLLELLAEPMGWAVIERQHLPAITKEAIREKREEMRQQLRRLDRLSRTGGGL